MNLIKLGAIALGGYFIYSWYQKRGVKKDGFTQSLEDQYKDVPFTKQPQNIQMGNHLTTEQKEDYILKNGNTTVFTENTMLGADGYTDNVILESSLSQQEGSGGDAIALADSTPANMLKDFKCLIATMKGGRFSDDNWGAIYKDQVDSLYVLVKCRKAIDRGEKGCEETIASQKAAEKGNKASQRLRAKNPKAVKAIMKNCAKNRRYTKLPNTSESSPKNTNVKLVGIKTPIVSNNSGGVTHKGVSTDNSWNN